ncbi:sulfate transporter family-domain-containing protein [Phakopsora pachyrhizi]|uniref:Sulfate transporter family-domain-containing protein n=1 Tax=Phakopsora pachyrhizi TaxID=170000 RepID=A0AAV0ANM3_PHAPC|nr:sulfate transporter family-domain-containing protein [Phakopsora pachyrhizi]CAH7668793.1 sulfate transporter family-domain-containing protein [Phakopsora pachyrhizi]
MSVMSKPDENPNTNFNKSSILPTANSNSSSNNNERSPLLPPELRPLDNYHQTQRGRCNQTLDKLSKRLRYYIPAFDWIPIYSPTDLLNDSVAGITLACLLVPQSIGYATQLAQIPAVNGLFSAAIPAIVYPLLCTGRHVSVGPEASLSLLVGHLVTQVQDHRKSHSKLSPPTDEDLARLSMAVTTLVTFQTGLISFGLGFFRLGFLDAVLSRALLRGFVTAIAVVIAIEQLVPILGLSNALKNSENQPQGHLDKLIWTIRNLNQSHRLSCLISLASVIFLVVIRIFKSSRFCQTRFPMLKYMPEILITAIISSLVTDIFDWDKQGVEVIGAIHAHQVEINVPWSGIDKSLWKDTFGTAVTLCICGLVDSIVAAKAESARFHYPISANRELVALGAANMASSFVLGDMPAYGSITRSRLNSSTGAQTPLASIITGITIIFSTYFLLDYLFFLPKCILGVVIGLVVTHLFSDLPPDLAFFWKLSGWTELALMTFTFLLTLVYDVRTGIIISAAVSLVLTVKDATRIRVRILGRDRKKETWEIIDPRKFETEENMLLNPNLPMDEVEEEIPGVLIVKIRESLSFANAGGLRERLRRLEMFGYRKRHPSDSRERDHARMIVFHLGDVEKIDPSSLQILKEIFIEYKYRGVDIWICHLQGYKKLEIFKRAGILEIVGQDQVLDDVNEVLKRSKVYDSFLGSSEQRSDSYVEERIRINHVDDNNNANGHEGNGGSGRGTRRRNGGDRDNGAEVVEVLLRDNDDYL